MTRRPVRRARGAALAVCVALGACAATKLPERFHTLMAAEPVTAAAAAAAPLYVDVLPVAVPPEVDRPEWVVRQADDSLLLLEQDRWAAPLRDELRSALVERLASRWGAIDVRGVAAPASAPWRVRVDVQRFESVPGREARLEAVWSVASTQRGAAPALVCRSIVQEAVGDARIDALAAAHRRGVQRLADAIGQRLQGMSSGPAARCD